MFILRHSINYTYTTQRYAVAQLLFRWYTAYQGGIKHKMFFNVAI